MDKKFTDKKVVIPASQGDMALTSVYGLAVDVRELDSGMFELNWAGSTPIGTFTVEASDPDKSKWVTLTDNAGDALSLAITGNTGANAFFMSSIPFAFVRPVYTKTSGTGILICTFFGKRTGK